MGCEIQRTDTVQEAHVLVLLRTRQLIRLAFLEGPFGIFKFSEIRGLIPSLPLINSPDT
jgi:hypothetical protein